MQWITYLVSSYVTKDYNKNYNYAINSYTMGMSGLPDISTQSLRARGLRAGEAMSAHGITTMYVTLLCTNCAWPSAKQFKPIQCLGSLYL